MDGPRVAAGAATAREPFDLTFRLNAGDYHAFVRNARWSGTEWTVSVLQAVAAFGLGVLLGLAVMLATGTDTPVSLAVAALVGGLVVYCVNQFALEPAYWRSQFTGQPYARADIKVVVDARGIASNMGDIVLALPWTSVQRVVDTDSHVFLLFARLAAVIVPKRAFPSAEEARRFVQFARGMAAGGRR
jgi:YcxB-like protein